MNRIIAKLKSVNLGMVGLLLLILLLPMESRAQNNNSPFLPASADQQIIKYIKNIASYFGINAEEAYANGNRLPSTPDINLISGTWAAVVLSFTPSASSIPSNLITALVFNQAYLATARLLAIDQPVNNATPTQQAIVNYLSTPLDCSATGEISTINQEGNVQCLPASVVTSQIAKIPMTPLYQQSVLPPGARDSSSNTQQQPGQTQAYNPYNDALNLNALLRPLSFSTEGNQQQGVALYNAINFIRFVTNQATPLTMPSYKTYSNYLSKIKEVKSPGSRDYETYKTTVENFNSFTANLRAFTAFASIVNSNFNALLARRLKAPGAQSSQAQADYVMATRRLFVPGDSSPNQQTQWYQQMEQAPPVTLQREMLYLLAEMNYQLYQMRAMQERELATLSAIQMQSLIPYAQSAVTLPEIS